MALLRFLNLFKTVFLLMKENGNFKFDHKTLMVDFDYLNLLSKLDGYSYLNEIHPSSQLYILTFQDF